MDIDVLRGLYESRQLDAAWGQYAGNRGSTDPAWHLYGALAAWRSDNRYEAKAAAEKGLSLDPDGGTLGRLLFVAGSVLREVGDYAAAVDHLVSLVEGWEEYPNQKVLLEGPAYHNLGLARYSQRETDESVVCFRHAANVFKYWRNKADEAKAVRNAAWSLCVLGDADLAARLLDGVDSDKDQNGRWHQQVGRAFVALVRGDYDATLAVTRSIIAEEDAPLDVMTQAAWLMGETLLAMGNLDSARQVAIGAQEWAMRARDARCISDAQMLITRIQEASQRGA